MKNQRRVTSYVGGAIIALLIYATAVTAFAASGTVTYNAASLDFNGTEVFKKGESIQTASGASIPSTIRYTDDRGGSTTYVPIRKIADTLKMPVNWDASTGKATMRLEGDLSYYARLYATPSTTASAKWSIDNVMKEVNPIIPQGGTTVLAPVNHKSADAFTAQVPLTSGNGRYVSITVANHSKTPVEFTLGSKTGDSIVSFGGTVPAGETVTRTVEILSPDGQPYTPLIVFVGYTRPIPWLIDVTISAVQFQG